MAMIICSECRTPVSDKAQVCPKCGNPVAMTAPNAPVAATEAQVKPQKKKKVWPVFLFIAGFLVFVWSQSSDWPFADGSGVSIDGASEAEEYVLQNLPLADGVNEVPGCELFAPEEKGGGDTILSVATVDGTTIEGYLVIYIEDYFNMFDMIVTYDGSVYGYMLGTQSPETTTSTALYTKMYDAKDGWLGD